MAFTVGMKVVCIAEANGLQCGPNSVEPTKGDIGTIVSIYQSSEGLAIELAEFPTPPCDGFDKGWLAVDFRPIVERKTEISFTIGADPESEKWDNRKPVPAYSFDVTEHESILQYLRGFY